MAQKPQTARQRTGPGALAGDRRRSCAFCKDRLDDVDFKNVGQLRRFVSERGRIRSRRLTGACRAHQHQVAVAVKRAREMALLPYAQA
jgi:small subunit ribosomal protein S18